MRRVAFGGVDEGHVAVLQHIPVHCEGASATKQSITMRRSWIASLALAMTAFGNNRQFSFSIAIATPWPTTDAHGRKRRAPCRRAFFHAMHRGHRQPRPRSCPRDGRGAMAPPCGLTKSASSLTPSWRRQAMPWLAKSLIELDQIEIADLQAQPFHQFCASPAPDRCP